MKKLAAIGALGLTASALFCTRSSFYSGRQEAQFDIGLINRWQNLQFGAFGSFKFLEIKNLQHGGSPGQAAFLAEGLFSRDRIGLFGTKGFKNFAVLNRVPIAPQLFLETYARIVDQEGLNALVGAWGNAYFEGNIGYIRSHLAGNDRPGGELKLVQPLNNLIAFQIDAGLNETLLNTKDSGRVTFGFLLGNYIRPKEYTQVKSPVPMDVPRVRYEIGTRRVGNSSRSPMPVRTRRSQPEPSRWTGRDRSTPITMRSLTSGRSSPVST